MFTLKELQSGERRDLQQHNSAMKLAAIRKIEELNAADGEGNYDIKPVPDGSTGGFVVIRGGLPPKRYFVKHFFTSSIRNPHGDNICEYFYYKIFQHLGYGPKCHAVRSDDKENVFISEDLSVVKTESGTKKSFQTHRDTLKERLETSPHNPSKKSDRFDIDFLALEILILLLEANDVHHNTGNIGTVVTDGPKTSPGDPKIKTKLVDLALPITELSTSTVTVEDVSERLRETWRSTYVEQLEDRIFRKKYDIALQHILEGTHKRPSLTTAIEMAYEDCCCDLPGESTTKLDAMRARLEKKVLAQQELFLDKGLTHL